MVLYDGNQDLVLSIIEDEGDILQTGEKMEAKNYLDKIEDWDSNENILIYKVFVIQEILYNGTLHVGKLLDLKIEVILVIDV